MHVAVLAVSVAQCCLQEWVAGKDHTGVESVAMPGYHPAMGGAPRQGETGWCPQTGTALQHLPHALGINSTKNLHLRDLFLPVEAMQPIMNWVKGEFLAHTSHICFSKAYNDLFPLLLLLSVTPSSPSQSSKSFSWHHSRSKQPALAPAPWSRRGVQRQGWAKSPSSAERHGADLSAKEEATHG